MVTRPTAAPGTIWSSCGPRGEADDAAADLAALGSVHCAVVWRAGERPVFAMHPAWEDEAQARWVGEGWIERLGQ